ncbi:MAG: hypothetical protein GDA50_07180 [Alphaproteobacteria bacterium GM202ARS2]|nr:hypothetical protein [Alphaproteobacteria bacterium GM202ARS2]
MAQRKKTSKKQGRHVPVPTTQARRKKVAFVNDNRHPRTQAEFDKELREVLALNPKTAKMSSGS